MCVVPNINVVPNNNEQKCKPLWNLQKSATYQTTAPRMYNVMSEETGEMQNYQELLKSDSTRATWSLGMCKELGRLPQGFKGLFKGTNMVFLIDRQQIREIPENKTVTYARIGVDY